MGLERAQRGRGWADGREGGAHTLALAGAGSGGAPRIAPGRPKEVSVCGVWPAREKGEAPEANVKIVKREARKISPRPNPRA